MLVVPRSVRRAAMLVLALAVLAGGAEAACYADYKAKRDNPFALQYGVIELPDAACSLEKAPAEIARRIAVDGWILLKVQSLFGDDSLAQRRESAGDYFLRY